jgi:predicted CopG family antitoxin
MPQKQSMPDGEKTNIEVTTDVWHELNTRKRGPSDSFDDVLRRVLEMEPRD